MSRESLHRKMKAQFPNANIVSISKCCMTHLVQPDDPDWDIDKDDLECSNCGKEVE